MEIPCRIRVVDVLKNGKFKDLSPDMEVSPEIREKWITSLKNAFSINSDKLQSIRPWDIHLYPDGNIHVDQDTTPQDTIPQATIDDAKVVMQKVYPVRYQIPFNTLKDVPAVEHPLRIENFALGCLIYEITTLRKPYADLSDDAVKLLYNEKKYPENPTSVNNKSSFFSAAGAHIRAHPYTFGLGVTGVAVLTGAIVALPILGAIGLSAAGPVAGSAAAAWQASLGVVQAGSIFAWCQSAAMGGAAVGGIIGAGAAGAGAAGAATVASIPGVKEKVAETFKDASNAVKDPGWQENVKGALHGAVSAVKGPEWQQNVKGALNGTVDSVKNLKLQQNVSGSLKGVADAIADSGWRTKITGIFRGREDLDEKISEERAGKSRDNPGPKG